MIENSQRISTQIVNAAPTEIFPHVFLGQSDKQGMEKLHYLSDWPFVLHSNISMCKCAMCWYETNCISLVISIRKFYLWPLAMITYHFFTIWLSSTNIAHICCCTPCKIFPHEVPGRTDSGLAKSIRTVPNVTVIKYSIYIRFNFINLYISPLFFVRDQYL